MSTSQRESMPHHLPTDSTQPTAPTQPTEAIQERVRSNKPSNKRIKSDVWHHFTKIEVSEGVFEGATCNHCHKLFAWSNLSGTTTMLRHITENRCRNYKCNFVFKSPRNQHVYDEETSRRDFAIACVKHNYPFNMGEYEYFEAYIKGINPYVKLPSRNTIKSDVLGLYEDEKARTTLVNHICTVALLYGGLYGGTLVPSGMASSSSHVSERKGYLYMFSDWYDASHESSVQNELEVYLKEPILSPQEDLDILKWWSINCKRLPILQKIARDLLAITATTVASESTFRVGGRIIDEERSLLGPQAFKALVTVKDWIPSINKLSRQSMPIIGEEVFKSRSEEVDEVEA